jgi:hypothetical protein
MDIIKIIQETATWIEKVNNDYDFNLYRTPELIPNRHYCDVPDYEKSNAVSDIVAKRSILLKEANVSLIPVNELSGYGRVMLFNPGQAIWDGAAEDASAYYIDYTDSPPFDTWIATVEQLNIVNFYQFADGFNDNGVIIGWVPKSQYFFVDEAIQVSMLGLYDWSRKEYLNEEFFDLKEVFTQPEEVIKSPYPTNIQNRVKRLDEIRKAQDKNSPPVQSASLTDDKTKGFFKRLFGK